MSLYTKYPIKMTSNTSPSPFKIENISGTNKSSDVYKVLDGNTSTYIMPQTNKDFYFTITLDKKVKINKIVIILQPYGLSNNINYGKIYAINDNNNEIQIGTIPSKNYGESYNQQTITIDLSNNNKYLKYKFLINIGYSSEFRINELKFYSEKQKLIFHNEQYYGLDSKNNFVAFTDISMYEDYSLQLSDLNIDTLKDKYPFKVLKIN